MELSYKPIFHRNDQADLTETLLLGYQVGPPGHHDQLALAQVW